MNAGESLRDQVGQMASVRPRKHGPEAQNRRDGALRGESPLRKRARRRKALVTQGASRRSIPSGLARRESLPSEGGEESRRTPRLAKNRGGGALAFLLRRLFEN